MFHLNSINFVIDVTIWHYLKECLNQGSLRRALCLSSETHTWLGTNSSCFIQRKLEQVMSNSRREELDVILCPLHMNESLWGLIVIHLLNGVTVSKCYAVHYICTR